MKRMIFLLFLSPVFIYSQIVIKKPETVFNQLIGTWQFGSNTEYESWSKEKHIYYGKIFSIAHGDTTISEECRIYKLKGEYFFEQKIVLNSISSTSIYKLVALDQKFMEFENRHLTFPQKIGYEWLPNDILAIVQEGVVNGRTEFLDFSYTKVK